MIISFKNKIFRFTSQWRKNKPILSKTKKNKKLVYHRLFIPLQRHFKQVPGISVLQIQMYELESFKKSSNILFQSSLSLINIFISEFFVNFCTSIKLIILGGEKLSKILIDSLINKLMIKRIVVICIKYMLIQYCTLVLKFKILYTSELKLNVFRAENKINNKANNGLLLDIQNVLTEIFATPNEVSGKKFLRDEHFVLTKTENKNFLLSKNFGFSNLIKGVSNGNF